MVLLAMRYADCSCQGSCLDWFNVSAVFKVLKVCVGVSARVEVFYPLLKFFCCL